MNEVIIFVDYYIPGNNGGGSTRSVVNLISHLNSDFSFIVISRDRDLGDAHPYNHITSNKRTDNTISPVYYLSPSGYSYLRLKKLLLQLSGKIFYLNSYFSFHFSIKPLLLRRFGLIRGMSIVLAPRGEFSSGAMSIRPLKKRIFILLSKLIGLHKGIIWQASTQHEEDDIKRVIGNNAVIKIAPDLPEKRKYIPELMPRKKQEGEAKIIFLSRISKKKNLHHALNIFRDIDRSVIFDIYGPVEDKLYWHECCKIIESLPTNVKVNYRGNVQYENVLAVFSKYHLFLFPTLGENYGHVIIESMMAGCPVLISNQTPWNDLERYGAGWNYPLYDSDSYKNIINSIVEMTQSEFDGISLNAYDYAKKRLANVESIKMNRDLFESIINLNNNSNIMISTKSRI